LKIDLHMHTTYSDGKLTPTELVRLLHDRGVDIAAVSDHDSTEGITEALGAAEAYPELRIVPAVEISADHPTDPKGDVHVLGYFLDHHHAELGTKLASFRDNRLYRGQKMVERLIELGYKITWEHVLEIAGEAGIGRPHIAQALVDSGYIAQIKDAFDGILDDDGVAFVDRPHISMAESAALIRAAGGVTVLAHPVFIPDYESLLPQIGDLGFVGFEVHYGDFDTGLRSSLLALANKYHMLPCGGSDYHAMGHEGEHLPGTAGPPLEVFEELERLAIAGRAS
jgi:predicted metal-dependent phosphoesterase TrpH